MLPIRLKRKRLKSCIPHFNRLLIKAKLKVFLQSERFLYRNQDYLLLKNRPLF
jgi:hypothetical protein